LLPGKGREFLTELRFQMDYEYEDEEDLDHDRGSVAVVNIT
jgi:hypothetical protein